MHCKNSLGIVWRNSLDGKQCWVKLMDNLISQRMEGALTGANMEQFPIFGYHDPTFALYIV